MSDDIPVKAISIMQPWSWLIVNGHKDIENRDWPTRFRGPVAIHAGKKLDESAWVSVTRGYHPVTNERIDFGISTDMPRPIGSNVGGIVGVAEIVDCVHNSDSEWFLGEYGFVIRNARPVEFIPVRGALSFFDWRKNLVVS